MLDFEITCNRPTPIPTSNRFIKRVLSTKCDPDEKVHAALVKKCGFGYRQGIGELVYAMVTSHPEIYLAVVKLKQASAMPT